MQAVKKRNDFMALMDSAWCNKVKKIVGLEGWIF